MFREFKYIITFFILSSTIGLWAQQAIPTWDFKGRGNAYTSIAGQFDLSGYFLMVSKKAEENDGYANRLMVFDKNTEIIAEKPMPQDQYDIMFLDIIQVKGADEIILLGVATSKRPFSYYEYDSFVFMRLNDRLEVLDFKVEYIGSSFGFRHIGHHTEPDRILIIISSDWGFEVHPPDPNFYYETVFLAITWEGDLISQEMIKDAQGSCQCVMPSPQGGYFCPGFSGYILNDNYKFLRYEGTSSESPMAGENSTLHFANLNKTCLLWTSNKYLINNTFASYLGNLKNGQTVLFLMDAYDFEIKKSIPIGFGSSAFGSHSMSITRDSFVYTGNYTIVISVPETIVLAKYDKQLNNVWQLNYTLPGYNHAIAGIQTTIDDGFIIYGYRRESGKPSEGVPFVTKFDENGIPTGTSEGYMLVKSELYPNPATDILKINIRGIEDKTDLRLFDMAGRNVYVHSGLQQGENSIDISGLPAGTYIYKLYRGSRETGRGEVVKL